MDFFEMQQFMALLHVFTKADANKNGLLDGSELGPKGFHLAKHLHRARLSRNPQMYQQLFTEADANHDSQLDPAEFKHLLLAAWESFLPPHIAHLFKKNDKDSNGVLEGAELDAVASKLQRRFHLPVEKYKALLARNPAGKMDKPAFKHLFVSCHGHSPSMELPPKMAHFFNAIDKDRNGLADKAELAPVTEGLQRRFWVEVSMVRQLATGADRNADGSLGPGEFQALVQAAREQSVFGGVQPKTVAIVHKADANCNRVIDGAELATLTKIFHNRFGVAKDRFKQAQKASDTDSDGRLQPQELGHLLTMLGLRKAAGRGGLQVMRKASTQLAAAKTQTTDATTFKY